MMVKTYTAIGSANLVTSVFGRDGKEIVLEFDGGCLFPIRKSGTFTTASSELQQAIESSPGYGTRYVLADGGESPQNKKTKILRAVELVRNKQMAIEWIRLHLGQEFTMASSTEVILDFLQAQGVVFNHWRVKK